MTTTQRHRDRGELDDRLVKGSAAVIATDLDGVITHWSAGAQRLYGWTGEEAIGNPLLDLLVAPAARQTAAESMESVRRTGDWEGEFDLRRKGGGIVLSYVRSTVIKDDAGRHVGVLGLSMDLAAGVSGRA
jgi:PAS domain S-box-containing protein